MMMKKTDIVEFNCWPKNKFQKFGDFHDLKIIDFDEISGELHDLWSSWDQELELVWAGTSVKLDLKYELSGLFEEICSLFERLIEPIDSKEHYDIATDTFQLLLDTEVKGNILELKAEWLVVHYSVNKDDLKTELNVDRAEFMHSLSFILSRVEEELACSGFVFPYLSLINARYRALKNFSELEGV